MATRMHRDSSARSSCRRAAAAALAAALCIALVPAGGVTICLGEDGHVGVAAASADETSHCPCDAPAPVDSAGGEPQRDGDAHPPCDDLPLPGTTAPVARGAVESDASRALSGGVGLSAIDSPVCGGIAAAAILDTLGSSPISFSAERPPSATSHLSSRLRV